MPVTITGTAADPTTSPQATGAADGDAGTSAALAVTPLQAILNFIAWLRADGVSAATPNKSIRRDAAGRAQVVAPSADGDIATLRTTTVSSGAGWQPPSSDPRNGIISRTGKIVTMHFLLTAAVTGGPSFASVITGLPIPDAGAGGESLPVFFGLYRALGTTRYVALGSISATGVLSFTHYQSGAGALAAIPAAAASDIVSGSVSYVTSAV